MRRDSHSTKVARAEKSVLRAALGCIDKKGYAFSVATESIAKTYFINTAAFTRLENAVAKLKEARRTK